ncbi:MAG: GGDEF domain-containing protein [Pseudomonadota bacterium]
MSNVTITRIKQGILLSLGFPIGWLCIEMIHGISPIESIMSTSSLYVYMSVGSLLAFAGFGWFIGRKEDYILQLAIHDSLTGIFNRRYFEARLEEEILRAQRDNISLCLISFDLDRFKSVNDNYGHASGDRVLKTLTDRAKAQLRKHDVFARVGGEEFSIMLPNCQLDDAEQMAERIRLSFSRQSIVITKGKSIVVTASFGGVKYQYKESFENFLKRADEAVYASKNDGRNKLTLIRS